MNDVSWNTIRLLILRHFATVLGGWLMRKGYIDASAVDGVVGALVTIGGVAGSVWQKGGQAKALQIADAISNRAIADADYWREKALQKKPPAPSVTKQ